MTTRHLSMRKLLDILRLRLESGLSVRQIARATRVSVGAVSKYLLRAQELGLTGWPLPEGMDEASLQQRFFPQANLAPRTGWVEPDWVQVHIELRRKGVTRQLLWEEYAERHGENAYSYPQYCHRYGHWLSLQRRSLRMTHRAGEKLFIDYCGPTIPIVNPETGEFRSAQIFVATLGASSYTYVEATWSQSSEDWLASHVRCLEFLGGVPEILVPDNLKAGVSKACRYDPDINPAYQRLAEHYRVAVVPARPYRPKDKAKVEVAVQVVERWLLARLRHQTFFSLAELNAVLRSLLSSLNERPFKGQPGSRRQLFEQLDLPTLRALPSTPFDLTDVCWARVNIDYHVAYQDAYYSVHHSLVGQKVEVHVSRHSMHIYLGDQVVACHPRRYQPGFQTLPGHMPERHQAHESCNPGKLKNRAQRLGPHVLLLVDRWLTQSQHPEQVYRRCLGLLRLADRYPVHRLDKACERGLALQLNQLKRIRSILDSNLDQLPLSLPLTATHRQDHENLRDPSSFH